MVPLVFAARAEGAGVASGFDALEPAEGGRVPSFEAAGFAAEGFDRLSRGLDGFLGGTEFRARRKSLSNQHLT
jgi:hypothetical protein